MSNIGRRLNDYLAREIKEFYPLILSNHTDSMLLDLPAHVRILSLKNQNQLDSQTTPIELNTARHLLILIQKIVSFLHLRKRQPQEKYWIEKLYNYLNLFETFLQDYQQQNLSDRLVFKTIDAFKILSLEVQLSHSPNTTVLSP
ncbi:MAG: hypothetical protein QNJ54_07985 [Prochloraceae cyanobacterium]|nr:hypothetical protein [Prochloraceae cyanobacterium]